MVKMNLQFQHILNLLSPKTCFYQNSFLLLYQLVSYIIYFQEKVTAITYLEKNPRSDLGVFY
jgi:hypothetical protein